MERMNQSDFFYFFAQISHELRTPLNAIKGFGDLLMEETVGGLNERQKLYLGKMQTSSDKLLEIVNQILDWAKLESGQLTLQEETVDLCRVAQEVESLLELKLRHKQIAFMLGDCNGAVVTGDRGKLREVLINLIGNAIKFSEANSRIEVDFKLEGDRVVMWIQDEGCGISADHLEQLFQPFSKGRDRPGEDKSTGLGLWICRTLVEMHGGNIWVKSAENAGSTFYVSLPRQMKQVEHAGS